MSRIVTNEMVTALRFALEDTPFICRRNRRHRDKQWEVVERTNSDWREAIGTDEDFAERGRFSTKADADALFRRLNYERICRAVLAELKS